MKKLLVLLAFATFFIGCKKSVDTPTLDKLGNAVSEIKDTSELRNYFNNPDLSFKYFYQIFIKDPSNLPLRVYFKDPQFNQTNDTVFATIYSSSPNSIDMVTTISAIKKDGNFLIDYLSNIHFEPKDVKTVELPIEFKVLGVNDSVLICNSRNLYFGPERGKVRVYFEIDKNDSDPLNKELFSSAAANKDGNVLGKGIFIIDLENSKYIYEDPNPSITSSYIEIFKAKPVKLGW